MISQHLLSQKLHEVISVAEAVVDITICVTEDELVAISLKKGGYRKLPAADLQLLLDRFADREHAITPGGSVSNSIDLLGREGIRCHLITGLGDDSFGAEFTDSYRRSGVTISNIGEANLPTGRSVILVTPDGERTMSTHLGASEHLRSGALETVTVQPHSLLIVEGYTLRNSLGPSTIAQISSFVTKTKERHGASVLALPPVSVIVQLAPKLQEITRYFDIVFGNIEEHIALLGVQSLEDAEAAALHQPYASVVTRGAQGASAYVQGCGYHVPAIATTVVDLTGAGDAFLAGLVAGVMTRLPVEAALAKGAGLAAEVVQVVGARLP